MEGEDIRALSCKAGTGEAHGKGKELRVMELLEEDTKGKTDS